MALRLFDNDQSSAPRPKFADDVVGRFRSGYQVNGRPATLEKWRVTTGDPEVAAEVHTLLGGKDEAAEWETKGEDNLELFTDTTTVPIIIEPDGIRSEMVLWGQKGAIRRCDGATQKDPMKGQPCACPSTLADRKDAAKAGHGCQPSITVVFRLADNPGLGKFRFTSGSWQLARDINEVEEALASAEGPATATLGLQVVEFTTKENQKRRFIKPVISVEGAA